MSKKLPAFQFYTGDWLKDPRLSMCSAMTRGIWIDFLCAMHELDRVGELRGTTDQLARVARCSPVEVVQALDELSASKTADVTERNGVHTITNRRMRREFDDRERNRKDVQNYREKQNVRNGKTDVRNAETPKNKGETGVKGNCKTNVSSYSSSSSSNNLQSGGGECYADATARGKPPPSAADLSAEEKTKRKIEELEAKYPDRQVRQLRLKYLDRCAETGKQPKWQIFEKSFLQNEEFETMDAKPDKPAAVDFSQCPDCDVRGMREIIVEGVARRTKCRHENLQKR